MKKTQEEVVKDLLREGRWISQVQFVQRYILRAAARIRDLRMKGWNIASRPVEGHPFYEYLLVSEPKEDAA